MLFLRIQLGFACGYVMLETYLLVWGYLVLPSRKFLNDVSSLLRTSCRTWECTVASSGFSLFISGSAPACSGVRQAPAGLLVVLQPFAVGSIIELLAYPELVIECFLLFLIRVEPELIRRNHPHLVVCREH
jgi:hypothetical protein